VQLSRNEWLMLGGGAVAFWWLFMRDQEPGGVLGEVNQMLDALVSLPLGRRLTHCPYDTTTGVVPCDPESLASEAGTTVEAYSLARAIHSEEGSSSNTTKIAVAFAIVNYARGTGQTITSLVTYAKHPDHSGYYGTQADIDPDSDRYKRSDRYCSTAADPYAADLAIAEAVLGGQLDDITDGATQFDRPAGERDPDAVAANRAAAGMVAVDVPGVDSGLRFWRHA
jgi:hypothetical protein